MIYENATAYTITNLKIDIAIVKINVKIDKNRVFFDL